MCFMPYTYKGCRRAGEPFALAQTALRRYSGQSADSAASRQRRRRAAKWIFATTLATGTVREGGSIGFQVGASSTDLIMLVMNERGANKLLASTLTLCAARQETGTPRVRDDRTADSERR
jgi:lipid-binding SYLF domain-containing protein